MSKSLKYFLPIAITLGLSVGILLTYKIQKSDSPRLPFPERDIASLGTQKPLFLGKHLAVISVALQTNEIPESEDSELNILGYIRLNQPADNDVQYKWTLPEGVYLVEGQTEDSLSGMKAGEVAQVKITVRGFSKESLKLISFQSFIQIGDSQFGNSSVISSRPDDSIEVISPTIAQKISR